MKTNESIWDDMQDRGTGEILKKEDELGPMDVDRFYEYIKSIYSDKAYSIDKDNFRKGYDITIVVDPIQDVCIFASFNDSDIAEIMVSMVKRSINNFTRMTRNVFRLSANKFTWKPKENDYDKYFVTEKDGSITKKTYIDLINLFFKDEIYESVWSDMEDRGTGDLVKKEDDVSLVNTLSREEFFEYLKDHYKCWMSEISMPVANSIYVPILRLKEDGTVYNLAFNYKGTGDLYLISLPWQPKELNGLISILEKKFGMDKLFIETDVDNALAIEVLDTMLANVDRPLTRKRRKYVNESKTSVWDDMQDRGVKDTVKKEDELTQDEYDDLEQFLVFYATRVVRDDFSEDLDSFCDYIESNETPVSKDTNINRILDYVRDNWADELCDRLSEYVDLERENMNKEDELEESVWSDMQERGTGDITKKEDDVNLMDMDRFADYLRKIYDVKNGLPINSGNKYIILPVLSYRHTNRSLLLYPEKKRTQVRRTNYEKWPEGIRDYLDDNYDVEMTLDEKKDWMYFIFPKNGKEANNRFFISLIDDILAHVDEPLLERKVNESIWSDMQEMGTGDITKKEDDVDLLDMNEFFKYIKKNYGNKLEYLDKFTETISINTTGNLWIYLHYKNRELSRIQFVLSGASSTRKYKNDFEQLKNSFPEGLTIEHENSYYYIAETSNKSVIKLIDYFLGFELYESVWSDMQDRGTKETEKVEDAMMSEKDEEDTDEYVMDYANEIVYGRGDMEDYGDLEGLIDHINKNTRVDTNVEKIKKYIRDHWEDEIKGGLEGSIDQCRLEYRQDMSESVWSDMESRGAGETVKKEDDMLPDDFLMMNHLAKMFTNTVRACSNPKNPVPIHYDDTCKDFVKYIDRRRGEHLITDGSGKLVSDKTYFKIMKFVKDNWNDCVGIQEFVDKYLNDLNECDGVPGGLTPADVGGMGAAYFPGPNGEPGSGDLPMPTGKVYHQIAPFGVFIKERKRKKKGKKYKKFRKEDEPCVHSPNAKVYDYVDDYREYVDRTYDIVNRMK